MSDPYRAPMTEERLALFEKHLQIVDAARTKHRHALDNLGASLTLQHVNVDTRAEACRLATEELQAALAAMHAELFPEDEADAAPVRADLLDPAPSPTLDFSDVYQETGVAG